MCIYIPTHIYFDTYFQVYLCPPSHTHFEVYIYVYIKRHPASLTADFFFEYTGGLVSVIAKNDQVYGTNAGLSLSTYIYIYIYMYTYKHRFLSFDTDLSLLKQVSLC